MNKWCSVQQVLRSHCAVLAEMLQWCACCYPEGTGETDTSVYVFTVLQPLATGAICAAEVLLSIETWL